MVFDRRDLSEETLLKLYKEILKPRLMEEKMLILLRQGGISKWFSGIGQEAISTGTVCAVQDDEYILPAHRNLGIFTGRNIPYYRLISQFMGKMSGFTKGRDRSFHFGSSEFKIVGMISHLGPQLAVADGIALGNKLEGKSKLTVVFTGEGAASEGDFHEALNLASVWKLPVLFIVENNGYAISTPVEEQLAVESFVDKAAAYGIESVRINGNNILDVYSTIKEYGDKIRKEQRPIMIEMLTFRMRGHEESSGTKYVPEALLESWKTKDPVERYEQYLFEQGVLSHKTILEYRQEIKEEIEKAIELAMAESNIISSEEKEIGDMYADYVQKITNASTPLKSSKRYVDAIQDGLKQAMERYKNLILMGQDIAEYGGVFKATEGLVEKFGKDRVRNTPMCESAVIGSGLGLSINGYKSVIEMQFADFVSCGFNQIVNNLAKTHYRWGQNVDVVLRMPTGAGNTAGPFHSQSTEAWFFHTPGLKIVYPSNSFDAKGLLLAAIEDPNPVLFFEHKLLYRTHQMEIPDDYYTIPIGEARYVQIGTDLSIITYGMGVHWAQEVCKELGVEASILDLRSLMPWDKNKVKEAVGQTGKALILTEDTLTGSIASEIASWVTENCFHLLDAPVMRVGSLDTAVPFAAELENNFLPIQRLKAKIEELMQF